MCSAVSLLLFVGAVVLWARSRVAPVAVGGM